MKKNLKKNAAESRRLLNQFNEISSAYALATLVDPNKRFVQYPEALRMLGELKGMKVLDIGCSSGVFTQMIKHAGADEVIGFNPPGAELVLAKKAEKEKKLGIKYVSSYSRIPAGKKFDVITAVMVLPAVNSEQLEEIFIYSYDFLKDDGKFVAVTLNPNFKRFGKIVSRRKFIKRVDGRIDIDFYDENGNTYLSIDDADFSQAEIEQTARKVGFKKTNG